MLSSTRRWAARSAPPIAALVVAAVVACTDVIQPSPRSSDSWAEQALVSLEVQSHVRMLSGGIVRPLAPTVTQLKVPVLADQALPANTMLRKVGSDIDVRHLRSKDGRVLSFARVRSSDGRPPKRTYFFENGRPRAVASAAYRRHGDGWIRTGSLLTVFDSVGRPVAQIDARHQQNGNSVDSRMGASFAKALADATAMAGRLILPAELHAEETACVTEWLAVASASLMVAELLAELTTAAAACARAVLSSCALITPAAVKLLASMGALNLAWDKLKECRERAPSSSGGGDGYSGEGSDYYDDGGGYGGGGGDGSSYDDIDRFRQTVNDFIEDAEADGRFACSDNGDICTYYLE
jgi:hypothetical protein